MRTFVINLDSSKLRMAEMSDQLSALLSNIEKIQQPWDIIKLCDPPKKKVVFKSVQLHCDFKLCLYKKVPSGQQVMLCH